MLSSVIRRRIITLATFFLITFVIFRGNFHHLEIDKFPQMNDRKILETHGLIVIPSIHQPIDSLINDMSGHPKSLQEIDLPNTDIDVNPVNRNESVTVVLVMAANRAAAITNHLNQLIKYRPSVTQFPIVISQDGSSTDVTAAIKKFVDEKSMISFIHYKDRKGIGSPAEKKAKNYFFIAQHYKWALDKIFLEMKYDTAIITEDDLDIAEDFFSYFSATKNLLRNDRSIWCISAWNDNGGSNITDKKRSEILYRTDFFPGLGWMLTADLWRELSPKWPEAYWDDWLRRQDIRNNRVCIRPEVSRTSHNNFLAGKGSSGGLYKKYLASIHLPESKIDFSLLDLSYLLKQNYDKNLLENLREAMTIRPDTLKNVLESVQAKNAVERSYRVFYNTPREYRRLARLVGLMIDIRSGMPRTAYYGIITFFFGNSRFYFISSSSNILEGFSKLPSSSFYDQKWDQMTKFLEFEETYCKPERFAGKCDPMNPKLIEWFMRRKMFKRLQAWGQMTVN